MKLQYYETNPLYISVGTLENEIIVSFNAKDEMQIGKLLFAKYPTLWKNDPKKTKEINGELAEWLLHLYEIYCIIRL